jgi:hypothetical protein
MASKAVTQEKDRKKEGHIKRYLSVITIKTQKRPQAATVIQCLNLVIMYNYQQG